MLMPAILIATAQLSTSFLTSDDHMTPQIAATRVAACGARPVTVRFDTDLDSDVLVVGATAISDRQLACIDKGASFYDVELPPSVQPRFDGIREARYAALMASEARKWLKTHNLLDRLPKHESGLTDDAAFGREVEALCGADQALQSRYSAHALNPEWAMQHATDVRPENGPLACLLNVAWATGFKIGFIGNERASPSNGR